MKKKLLVFSIAVIMVSFGVTFSWASGVSGRSDSTASGPLVAQTWYNFTENPVDIPNPDRGFERSNDDAAGLGYYYPGNGSNYFGYMTVPASADTILGQTFQLAYEMNPPYYLGIDFAGPEYANTPVEPRIVQFYLVLNEFSSNAWCDSGLPSGTGQNAQPHARQGIDGPITPYGLNFIRNQLQFIRDSTNSVAHIRVCYDPKGWNHFVWTQDNLDYEDLGPATATERYYYRADYTKPITTDAARAAHIAKPGAGTWRGSSPVFRQCTVPGFTHLNWVQYHYLQLKPIFQEYSDIIWAFDSGTFGPWGETHSNYEAEVPGHYKMLLDALLDAVPDGKPIMTFVGAFLDWYNRTYNTTYNFGTLHTFPTPVRGTPEARFGMFDDSNGWSDDEYIYGDNGSLSEGYRMLAHDPILPGYNPNALDPSLTRVQAGAPGGRVSPIRGYNDSGTNRLLPIPEEYDDALWRGVYFVDWDRTKLMTFLGKMSVYGGEGIGTEPASGTNGGFVPVGQRIDADENDVIFRFPSMIYEHSIARYTYLCIQQGRAGFKSRADYLYTRANIEVDITYPWSGQTVRVLYDPVYEGQSALAYYRDRLGYRLVMREARATQWVDSNGLLQFEGKIQNVGWGVVFSKKAVKVILKDETTGYVSNAVLTNIDPYNWQPAEVGRSSDPTYYGAMPDSRASNTAAWRDLSFEIPMRAFGYVPPGNYGIYLKINDPKERSLNKRSIRFANKGDGIWDEDLGANLIGKVTVRD